MIGLNPPTITMPSGSYTTQRDTTVADRAMYRKSHLDAYFESQVSVPRRSSSEPRRPAGEQPRMR
jgi:hypothetical protein